MIRLGDFIKKYDGTIFILGLVVIAVLVSGMTNAFADNIITYGKSTYNQVGGSIIFGSLGDEYAVSEFGALGNNDFIPENAFKNVLGYEGYSVAYDYNPTYDGYYPEAYNKALPTGVDLTKIQIAGLGANSRELQDVYVLTEEYNRLSATGQATSIDNLNSGLSNEASNRIKADKKLGNRISNETNSRIQADTKEKQQRISGDKKLQTNIDKETKQRKQADKTLQSNINKETTQRKTADKTLQKNINTEIKDRKSADKVLQKNINTETSERKLADKTEKTARILGDKKLQNNINIVDNNSQSRDVNLQNNINNEATTRATADTNLQNNINSANSRIDNVDERVSALEKTQFVIKTELKFIREKRLEVGVYTEYNVGRNSCSEIGINVVIPIGNSYLDRENKKINSRLDRLEQKIGGATTIERTLDSKGKVKSISISQGQLAVNGEF